MSKYFYICKRADTCPVTQTPCSPECHHTSRIDMAKYRNHERFVENERGDFLEQDPE